tara:strand:+ start:348 stop:1940 length:1593 start_codon:yes stop_codon:yes gene_type:complete
MAINLDFLKGLLPEDTNVFGASPNSNVQKLQQMGLLDEDALKKARQKSLFQGILGGVVDYVATPKNKNFGSALPYLGSAFKTGMGASQGVYDRLLKEGMNNQQLKDLADKQKIQDLKNRMFTTLPGKTIPGKAMQTPGQAINRVGPDGQMAIAPNLAGNITKTADVVVPEQRVLDEQVMQELSFRDPTFANAIRQGKNIEADTKLKGAQASAAIAKTFSEGLNIGKLQVDDYTPESWRMYATPGQPGYGDTRVLRANEKELALKLKKQNQDLYIKAAEIKLTQGVAAEQKFLADVKANNQGRLADEPTSTTKPKQEVRVITADGDLTYRKGDIVELPLTGEQIIPTIHREDLPETEITKLKLNQNKARKSYQTVSDELLLQQKTLRNVINSPELGKVFGAGNFLSLDKYTPGTPAYTVVRELTRIKNMQFLSNYKKIKATGGGLGSLTEREAVRLEELVAQLNEGISAQDGVRLLTEFDEILGREVALEQQFYTVDYGPLKYKSINKVPELNPDPKFAPKSQVVGVRAVN